MNFYPVPTLILCPEETPYGVAYRPVNDMAKALTRLMDRPVFRADEMDFIHDMGFRTVMQNGRPIPFPKNAYRRKPSAEPRHVLDEA
jgi:hypothetical protein